MILVGVPCRICPYEDLDRGYGGDGIGGILTRKECADNGFITLGGIRKGSGHDTIRVALFELLVWPHEVEPRFHSWYRGRVETLDAKYNLIFR